MKTSSVDVLIYINSNGAQKPAAGAIKKLGQAAGVISAEAHSRVGHLLAVKYVPQCVSASDLLGVVRQQGCTASLVGM